MSRKHRSGHKRKNDRILKIIAVLLAIIILICGILYAISLWEHHTGSYDETEKTDTVSQVMEFNGKTYDLNDAVETVLVLGLDKFDREADDSYSNSMQADFLMLLVIDNKKEECTALHINRDTVTEMSVLGVAGDRIDTVSQQLALAHTYGNGKEISCRNTSEAVSALLLNIEIDHYVSVTMDAVSTYNDLVGGVKVRVLDDFRGLDDTLIKGSEVTLRGEHALNYVRSRYGLDDSTNNRRMERQRQYLEALYEKTVECLENDKDFIVDSVSKISEDLVSDCSANRLESIAEKIADYKFAGIRYIGGETVMGDDYLEFYPEAESIKETVVELFYIQKTE